METYDGTFSGNILVVGQTRCRKTSFVQRLTINKMFGKVTTVEWISKVELSPNREHQLRESFNYASVEFHCPRDVSELETILDILKDNKTDVDFEDDDLGGNDVFDRLIVMDDVSGIADKSSEFCSFLTVS